MDAKGRCRSVGGGTRDWIENTSNGGTAKASKPDARLSIPKEAKADIVRRIDAGETQTAVAADVKISQQRVSQIVTAAKSKQKNVAKVNAIREKEVEGVFDGLYDVVVIDPPWPAVEVTTLLT